MVHKFVCVSVNMKLLICVRLLFCHIEDDTAGDGTVSDTFVDTDE